MPNTLQILSFSESPKEIYVFNPRFLSIWIEKLQFYIQYYEDLKQRLEARYVKNL